MRPSVDLPQPDSPTRPTTSPAPIARLTSSTARTTCSLQPAPNRLAIFSAEVERLHEALRDVVEREDGALMRSRGERLASERMMAARLRGAGKRRLGRHGCGSSRSRAGSAARRRSPAAASQRGRHARDLRQRLAAPVAARHRADEAGGIGMERASSTSATEPVSTIRPAYITAMRSARPAITERSCVIQISAVPVSRKLLHLGQDLRLDGDVERGGRLVGDEHGGPVQERDGDGDALAHAARELVRIGVEPLLGRGDADRARAPRGARSRAALSETRSCARIASIICVSMRRTGFSVVIGSWKIIAMRLPRSARSSLLRPADADLRRRA